MREFAIMRKWTNKLIQRLSNRVCVLHSRESENERGKNWNDCSFLSVRQDGRERDIEVQTFRVR